MSQTVAGQHLINVEAHTASDTLTTTENGTAHTNTGAAGAITLSLPAATPGLPNGSETISLPSNGVPGAAGKYLVADAVGETVHLVCLKAGSWSVIGHTGTWSAEA
jgi:hypothetical protein